MIGTIMRPCYRLKQGCDGEMVCVKDGKNGNNFEFKCNKCTGGLSIMDANSLDKPDKELFEKWITEQTKPKEESSSSQ